MIFDNSVIVDIEATGGVPKTSNIIEVGLLSFEKGKKILEWEALVNPPKKIPTFIQRHIGITNEMVKKAPIFKDISKELKDIIKDKMLIAHNVFIDLEFLRKEFRVTGYDYNPKLLCSLKLSQKLYPIFRKHGLDSVIERLEIKTTKRHRALGDVFIVWEMLQQMQRDFSQGYLKDVVKSVIKQINMQARTHYRKN